jgi:hypothetical protein
VTLSVLSLLAGLSLERIPTSIAGHAAHTSPLDVALAWLAALGIAAGFFAAVFAIGACMLSSRLSEAERREAAESFDQLGPVIGSRPAPTNAQIEPPFPAHTTVLTSIRSPSMVAHPASWLCDVEGPHPIGECGQVRATNPLGGESHADLRMRS